MFQLGKIKVRVGLLGISLVFLFLLMAAGPAAAGPLDQLLPTLPPLTSVSTTVNSLGLPIQLGTSSSRLPTVPAIDLNALIYQTTSNVNALQLPLQLPQVNLPLPTLPAIDPAQVVGTTVDQVNNAVPLPVMIPNPINLITQPSGGGASIPGLPGLGPGATGGIPALPGVNGLSGTAGIFGPTGTSGINGFSAANQAGFLPDFASLRTFGAPGSHRGSGGMNLAPAGAPEDSGNFVSLSTGLAILPLLGIICVFLALVAYFRSAQLVWHART